MGNESTRGPAPDQPAGLGLGSPVTAELIPTNGPCLYTLDVLHGNGSGVNSSQEVEDTKRK